MPTTNAQHIANELLSIEWMEKNRSRERLSKKRGALEQFVRQQGPSGAGIDRGAYLDMNKSTSTRIVLTCYYHHMNDVGYYDGWTEHTITVKPAFCGVDVLVGGKNRNDIKGYLGEVFHHWLMSAYVSNQVASQAAPQQP